MHAWWRGSPAGDILLLHDGNSARTLAGAPVIWKCCPTARSVPRGFGTVSWRRPWHERGQLLKGLRASRGPIPGSGRFALLFRARQTGPRSGIRALLALGLIPEGAASLIWLRPGFARGVLEAAGSRKGIGQNRGPHPARLSSFRGIELMPRDVERAARPSARWHRSSAPIYAAPLTVRLMS